MTLTDALMTEELRVSSGEKALDKAIRACLPEIFSQAMVHRIDRILSGKLPLKGFRQKSNIMCYTQGTSIYVNWPLFYSTRKDKAVNYIMHELMHVLMNTGSFPELKNVQSELATIVYNSIPRGKEAEFLTGKSQNIHSDWRGETLSYLCNNSIKWEMGELGTKLAYKETLEDSGLFNMKSAWWGKRFPAG